MFDLTCPFDTNGDGDCGKPACPFCGKYGGTNIFVHSKTEEELLKDKLRRAGVEEREYHFNEGSMGNIFDIPIYTTERMPKDKAVMVSADGEQAIIIDLEDGK